MEALKNNDKQDSKTFQYNRFQGYLEYVCKNWRYFDYFPKYLPLPGIEPATLWFCEYGISTILNRPNIYLLLIRLICIAPQRNILRPQGDDRSEQKKPFFHDRFDTKIHDTFVLKMHKVNTLSINVTGYDKSGKSGEERTGASFTTGRTRFPDVVLTSAERATASLPKLSLTTRARG